MMGNEARPANDIWKDVVQAVQSGRNSDFHRTGSDGGRDLLRRLEPQKRAQYDVTPIEQIIDLVKRATVDNDDAAMHELQAMGYTAEDCAKLAATVTNPKLRAEFVKGQHDWKLRMQRKPRGAAIAGRQQMILEPIGGTYDKFTAELKQYRQFHIARDQFTEFMERDGHGEQIVAVAPFSMFSLIVDDYVIETEHGSAGNISTRCEGITCTLLPQEMNNAWRVLAAWHVQSPYIDRHICSLAMVGELDGGELNMLPYGQMPSGFTVPLIKVPRDPGMTDEQHEDARELVMGFAMQGHQILMRFLHTLNHRSIKIVDATKANRPPRHQRRQEGYVEHPHYAIYIPANITYRKVAEEARDGKNMKKPPKGYDRRGHLRTDRYGRKRIIVRPHHVEGKTGEWSPYKIYSAHNVGKGGVDDG